jgi:hypothetical protein
MSLPRRQKASSSSSFHSMTTSPPEIIRRRQRRLLPSPEGPQPGPRPAVHRYSTVQYLSQSLPLSNRRLNRVEWPRCGPMSFVKIKESVIEAIHNAKMSDKALSSSVPPCFARLRVTFELAPTFDLFKLKMRVRLMFTITR